MQKFLKWAWFILGAAAFVAALVLSIYCAWKLNGLFNAADRYGTNPWRPNSWVIITIIVALAAGFFLGLAAAWPRPKKTEADKAKEAEKSASQAAAKAQQAAAKAQQAAAQSEFPPTPATAPPVLPAAPPPLTPAAVTQLDPPHPPHPPPTI